MEAQVENAIEIAWNPHSDPTLKAQAFDFLTQLRSEPQSWTVCLPIALRQPPASEVVRHFAIDIVNGAVQGGKISQPELLSVKESLLEYIRNSYGPGHQAKQEPSNIQNKFCEALTNLFVTLYPSEWTTFFDDLLDLTVVKSDPSTPQSAVMGTLFYIKVVTSIHDEIADVMLSRSSEEQQRDNALKDLVRERDVQKIASSWHNILSSFEDKDDSIVEQCLTAIGRWASWIDLSLIVNDAFLTLLFNLVSSGIASEDPKRTKLRDIALNTMMEILSKKMKGSDKLDLIEVLKVQELVARLAASSSLQDMRFSSAYDTDFAEIVAKLVNNTMLDIVVILERTSESEHVKQRANSHLKTLSPYMLRFFSDEYDEICSCVIPSLTDLLTCFRKQARSNPEYLSMLPPILEAIIAKMKYDETAEWGSEQDQTDEAEFQDLRKRLQILQQAVAAVDENLYMESVSNLIARCFDTFQTSGGQMDWRDIDLALHEMFLFGQLAVKNGSIYRQSKPVSPAAERLIAMMAKLVESNIASASHPAVHLQYMEICVRYSPFFEANPQMIPPVLEKFVQFVHHTHVKVRTRSWYLLHRFIKQLRTQLGDIAQTVIQAVSDLLPIKAELPDEGSDDDDMSSNENNQTADARFTSQLYLYEAVGNICSPHAVPVASQVLYVSSVMNPLFTDLEQHLEAATRGDARSILQVHHLVMALGTLAHGFSEWTPSANSPNAPPKEVSEEFVKAAEAILLALEPLNSSMEIRTAARASFSRLVGVLGNRILPQLPRWINGLLSKASAKDEMAMFIRLVDQVVFAFKAEIFDILNALLTPFLQRVFEGISQPVHGTDDKVQLAELKQQYLAFILVILSNDLGRVFITEENQGTFESLISTLEMFTKDDNDLLSAKVAFTVLSKMVSVWGGPDLVSADGSLTATTPTPSLPGFDRFMMDRFSPLVWVLPGNLDFNPRDAQSRNVMSEAAAMQKAIFTKTGQSYINYLQENEFKRVGIEGATANDYLQALSSSDAKKFRQYFLNLVQSLR